jgi:hypothetical protein
MYSWCLRHWIVLSRIGLSCSEMYEASWENIISDAFPTETVPERLYPFAGCLSSACWQPVIQTLSSVCLSCLMYVQHVPVVLCRRESWPLYLWEEQRLKAIEMKVLKIVLKGVITRRWRALHV